MKNKPTIEKYSLPMYRHRKTKKYVIMAMCPVVDNSGNKCKYNTRMESVHVNGKSVTVNMMCGHGHESKIMLYDSSDYKATVLKVSQKRYGCKYWNEEDYYE